MTRILMVVGVAAVAGAMYVAGASGSQQSRPGPTMKQFKALKAQVAFLKGQFAALNGTVGRQSTREDARLTKLENDDAQVLQETELAVGFISGCFLNSGGSYRELPVSQFGSASAGFLFGTSGSSATPRTALDIDTSGSPMAYLQEVNPACIFPFTTAPVTSPAHSTISRLQRWAARTR